MATTVATQTPPTDPTAHQPVADIEWKDAPRIIASGACMGTADLVPGVSGGTMAVALGIYREFLGAIDSGPEAVKVLLKFNLKRALAVLHWKFIASLGTGILIALIVMGKIVKLPQMVQTSPKPVYSVFFGLVLASTVVLMRRLKGWSPVAGGMMLLGGAVGYVVVQMVPVQTPENPAFVFLCGMIAITAMVLPGISGSFMLLVLGKYEYIITSVLSLKLSVAAPFALGCLVGIVAFSKFLGWLLDKFHDPMTAALTGLLFGSLIRIWPYQHLTTEIIREKPRVVSAVAYWPEQFELSVAGLMVFGIVLVLGVEFLASRRNTDL